MALINTNKFDKTQKERNSVHKIVASTYTSFTDITGNRYFQIDTYGSEDRKFQGKISQSLQMDKETAEKLIEVLKREFQI
ncbi:methionyl-tRNA formyltransferase [Robertmurraya yapensis]|uniref:Methionyl-tRNA formyltransferase n=1 Tax=Bacillus yapensis TaxID=2492960 RepID=A0A431WF42_9BACI|nr:methionyl-tRNA formyltransferase [Bacillus yapensis]RTR33931.1 methionyl-tRNA formyltransferase [Bacillus yapensis]TKS97249.1 methionyl-tRNA formyltransferase [Bacillus yapensis]